MNFGMVQHNLEHNIESRYRALVKNAFKEILIFRKVLFQLARLLSKSIKFNKIA